MFTLLSGVLLFCLKATYLLIYVRLLLLNCDFYINDFIDYYFISFMFYYFSEEPFAQFRHIFLY